jgi:hypothetical protein
MDLMRAWIDESYRAVAPKKLVAGLDAAAATPPVAGATRKKKPAAARKRKVR